MNINRVVVRSVRWTGCISKMRIEIFHVEWHLAPRGWVRGNWSTDKPLPSRLSPPDDRVETWVKTEMTHENNFAQAQREWSRIGVSSQHSEVDRQTLRTSIRNPAPETENPKLVSWDFPLG